MCDYEFDYEFVFPGLLWAGAHAFPKIFWNSFLGAKFVVGLIRMQELGSKVVDLAT